MKKKNKPTAILTADMHIRETIPESRIDAYLEAQDNKLCWLSDLQKEYDVPILDAGDIFNTWKCSHELVAYAIKYLPKNIITIPGNHDLPSLSLEKFSHSPMNVLDTTGSAVCINDSYMTTSTSKIQVIGFPWGAKPEDYSLDTDLKKVALSHYYVYEEESIPGIESERGINLLKRLKSYDLIVTGHNHKPFVVEYKNRLLVNPGSLMRMHADDTFKPRVYLWYSATNTVKPVYVPIRPFDEVISKEHIRIKEEVNKNLESFVLKLNDTYEASVSFRKNLEAFFNHNKTKAPIKRMVWDAVDN